MLSKSQSKYICSLHRKKNRQLHQCYLAEGPKIVNELIISNGNIKQIFATISWITQNSLSIKNNIEVIEITEDELAKISTLTTPNDVIAIVKIDTSNLLPLEISDNDIVLALDDIRDPGNMGTIIRTADWFGVTHIVCSETCVDEYNPKVIQATMGSIAHVKTYRTNLTDWLKKLNNTPIYIAHLNGESIYNVDLNNGVLIIGNESNGVSTELLNFATNKLMIPKYGKAESLNAAMATGILLSHFKK